MDLDHSKHTGGDRADGTSDAARAARVEDLTEQFSDLQTIFATLPGRLSGEGRSTHHGRTTTARPRRQPPVRDLPFSDQMTQAQQQVAARRRRQMRRTHYRYTRWSREIGRSFAEAVVAVFDLWDGGDIGQSELRAELAKLPGGAAPSAPETDPRDVDELARLEAIVVTALSRLRCALDRVLREMAREEAGRAKIRASLNVRAWLNGERSARDPKPRTVIAASPRKAQGPPALTAAPQGAAVLAMVA